MTTINVVHAGDTSSFDYLIFPNQNPANQISIQNQLQQFSQTLTDTGRKFLEASATIYQQIHDSDVARMARAALRSAKGIFHPNQIMDLETLEELQSAQVMMQRYIMAQPDIRGLYNAQRCDGYSDTYVDIDPGAILDSHYDYRRVMDTVIQEEGEGESYSWFTRMYCEDLLEGDRELDFEERVSILGTWDVLKMFVQAGKEDPTNAWGGNLG